MLYAQLAVAKGRLILVQVKARVDCVGLNSVRLRPPWNTGANHNYFISKPEYSYITLCYRPYIDPHLEGSRHSTAQQFAALKPSSALMDLVGRIDELIDVLSLSSKNTLNDKTTVLLTRSLAPQPAAEQRAEYVLPKATTL